MDKKTINLGFIEKIPLGQGFCFIVEKDEIAVFRPRSGGLYAIQNRCPHRRGPLAEGVCDAQTVICPYHGHKFCLQTGKGSEAGEEVRVFPAREEEGEILVDIGT
ncbi:MAG: nitrite reductase (NAD(P)H) small subunit [Deltaproteobacteria bacterium]|nr:nitrite reductase (NAD(P)H) small subunit [Deltaproteobacteria bacterium]